jgi:hypothetical protein
MLAQGKSSIAVVNFREMMARIYMFCFKAAPEVYRHPDEKVVVLYAC